MQRIGFIGLGLMGQHMARRLLDAGHPLTVWNRTAEKAKHLCAAGAAIGGFSQGRGSEPRTSSSPW